ncbi:MAG: gamma-glutamylcyclotransferase family protein [Pseudomonadota bacterium]
MSDPDHIFVYGTLRAASNHPMARRLAAQARHVGAARTGGKLYDMGWYPAAQFEEGAATRIIGDVYTLPPGDRLLAEIDAYEYGDPNYTRLSLEVSLIGAGKLLAWSYGVASPPNSRIIPGGDFLAHWNAKNRRPRRP